MISWRVPHTFFLSLLVLIILFSNKFILQKYAKILSSHHHSILKDTSAHFYPNSFLYPQTCKSTTCITIVRATGVFEMTIFGFSLVFRILLPARVAKFTWPIPRRRAHYKEFVASFLRILPPASLALPIKLSVVP